jgi:hypothetical protein
VRKSGIQADVFSGESVGIRDTITALPGVDGVERYKSFYRDRLIEIRGFVKGSTKADLYANIEILNSAIDIHVLEASTNGTDGFLPLSFTETGQRPSLYYAKPIKNSMTWSDTKSGLARGFAVLFECRDPKKYRGDGFGEGQTVTVSIAPGASSGSSGFPVGFPVAFAGSSLSGQTTFSNDGASRILPTSIEITGPCSAPSIANSTSGFVISFTSDLVLLSGQILQINSKIGTCYVKNVDNSFTNVIQYLTSDSTFWFLELGDNTITLSGATMSVGCVATITAQLTV